MKAADPYARVAELTQRGARFVMASITDGKGSSPRGVGTKMVVMREGSAEKASSP